MLKLPAVYKMNTTKNTPLNNFIANRLRPIELAAGLKFILGIKRKEYLIGENKWWLDPASNFGSRLISEGVYETDTLEKIQAGLKPGNTFIDLGANEGYFSILASKIVGATGYVHCIEPQKRLSEVIAKNIALNHCENIKHHPYLIAASSGLSSMVLTPSINTGASGAIKSNRSWLWKKQEVMSITLDELFADYKTKHSIALIKIDIEGFELFALQGATRLLKEQIIQKVLIEIHPERMNAIGQNIHELTMLLNSFGYKQNGDLYEC